MVAPFSTGRMGTGLWRAAGWKLQAAPHISLPCWVSYPLTGAAKNDISLTTVPDLIREGGKQCQTLALPGSMPPLLCHDSFQVTMLCAKLIQDMFFCKVERVWPQIWQPSHISWCMPSCWPQFLSGRQFCGHFFPLVFFCWPPASSELRTFYIILLNLSLGELGKPSVVGRFFPIG